MTLLEIHACLSYRSYSCDYNYSTLSIAVGGRNMSTTGDEISETVLHVYHCMYEQVYLLKSRLSNCRYVANSGNRHSNVATEGLKLGTKQSVYLN